LQAINNISSLLSMIYKKAKSRQVKRITEFNSALFEYLNKLDDEYYNVEDENLGLLFIEYLENRGNIILLIRF
jgi:hypothetical protein